MKPARIRTRRGTPWGVGSHELRDALIIQRQPEVAKLGVRRDIDRAPKDGAAGLDHPGRAPDRIYGPH